MQNIDRLLMKARKAAKGIGGCLAVGFVDHDLEKGMFTASCSVYGGRKGSESGQDADMDSCYNSQQEAMSALETMLSGMGIPEENALIFIRDYGTEV